MKFSSKSMHSINKILRDAFEDGRNMLYEYEIYQVLEKIGLEVPKFEFVKDPRTVNEKMLRKFGQDIVVKIVSPQISHKQKLGGVKKIRNYDPLYIQFVLTRMKEEVLSHFPEENKPEITGFLIVEYIPHTQGLGYEILIGFKEDTAFGPVLTLSKGGDDAEFFAKYYDPANLFLTHLDYKTAIETVNTLKIRNKFVDIGHPEYLEYIAKAASLLSWLAYNYSFVSKDKPEFIIKAMDINPFVITEDSRFVAIDGFAEFELAAEYEKKMPEVNLKNLDSFFLPQGVAIVGVSSDENKYSMGREIAHLMHDLGREDLYLVNPKGGTTTLGNKKYTLYKSINDIPDDIELIVYAAPAQYTIDFIKSMEGKTPKALVLIPGIPSNIQYSDFVRQLDEVVPEGMRVIGPNGMGVFYAPDWQSKGVNTLFIDEKRLEIKYSGFSNTVLLSQSGGLAITIIDKLKNARVFKSVVSFGNKYDVKVTDLISYFGSKDEVDVISMYIEGFDSGEGRQFYELARKTEKPIIVYKAGRTAAGAKAAASHTASMSGDYDVFKAACQQAGIILGENIEDYYDYVKAFSLLANKVPSSNRVVGVVNAGFESTVAADELNNLKQAQLAPSTIERLDEINKHGLVNTSSSILDVTAMTDDRMYAEFIEAVLQDEGVDCVFVGVVPHVASLKTTPDTCHDPDSLANLLVNLSRKYNKPMVVSVNAGQYYQDFVSIMEDKGLPVYNDIRSAVKSLDTFVAYHIKRKSK